MKKSIQASLVARLLLLVIISSIGWQGDVLAATAQHKHDKKQAVQMRRADLLIAGSSCATCLMRVEEKIKKAPGVINAAVSIYKPYPAIIIFDSDKTTLEKIRADVPNEPVQFINVTEQPIDKIPAVLLPVAANTNSASTSNQ